MFDLLAKAEAWIKRNGPELRHELELVAESINDAANALVRIASELEQIRRHVTAQPQPTDGEVIDGTAHELPTHDELP